MRAGQGAHDVQRMPSGGIFCSLEVWLAAQVYCIILHAAIAVATCRKLIDGEESRQEALVNAAQPFSPIEDDGDAVAAPGNQSVGQHSQQYRIPIQN